MRDTVLYIVIPCFNEQDVLPLTADVLKAKLDNLKSDGIISSDSRVLFVNNHSTDETFSYIEQFSRQYPDVFTGISLSYNCGQQIALIAGLETAVQHADIMITMDADLQDDPDAIDEMIRKYESGARIVYGVRSDRQKDSFFKRVTAKLFYRFSDYWELGLLSEHGDFRLLDKHAAATLCSYMGKEPFLRGIVTRLGFPTDTVYYERRERTAGESSYSVRKLFDFALSGITSISTKPLRFVFFLGFIDLILGAVVLIAAALLSRFATGLMIAALVLWLSGTNKLVVGILGEYIGKVYREVKPNPRYVVERNLADD